MKEQIDFTDDMLSDAETMREDTYDELLQVFRNRNRFVTIICNIMSLSILVTGIFCVMSMSSDPYVNFGVISVDTTGHDDELSHILRAIGYWGPLVMGVICFLLAYTIHRQPAKLLVDIKNKQFKWSVGPVRSKDISHTTYKRDGKRHTHTYYHVWIGNERCLLSDRSEYENVVIGDIYTVIKTDKRTYAIRLTSV